MKYAIGSRITPKSCFDALSESCSDHFFCPIDNRKQSFILISSASQKITDRHQSRNPHRMTVSQHGQRFFIHIVTVLQCIYSRLYRRLRAINSICMTHHGKSLFMGDMHHLFDLCLIQRCTCDFTMVSEIQQSRRHDLDKICALRCRFPDSLVEFSHIAKASSDNPAIMSFFMDSKNRCPIIDPIFSGNLCGSSGNSAVISSVTYKRNPCSSVSLKIFPDF